MVAKYIFIAVVFIALLIIAILFTRNILGKPRRGVLDVPRGYRIVDVEVTDDKPLKPYKYGQYITVEVVPEATDIVYRGKPVGRADATDSSVQALHMLARTYKKVTASMAIISIDNNGAPIAQLKLADDKWFLRAMKVAEEQHE